VTSPQPDRDPRCSKCEGRAVRRHHRKCPKRGACHKGRGAHAESLEGFAVSTGLDLRVRRGRHGRGLSTTQARSAIKSRLVIPPGAMTSPALQRRVAERLGLRTNKVQVSSPEPGRVAVQINARVLAGRLHALEQELRQDLPGSSAIHVESITAHTL
jgi:hypothetical protein